MKQPYGYIAERILCIKTQEVCYEGRLVLDTGECCVCGTLTLREAEAVQIRPLCSAHFLDRQTPIELTVLCTVEDHCGRTAKAIGTIRLNVQNVGIPGNVRYGASIRILRACSCSHGIFDIQALVRVQIVISQTEIIGRPCSCTPECPALPLYPQPHRQRDQRSIRCTYR